MFLFNAVSKYLKPEDRRRLELMASLPLEQCVFGDYIAVPEVSHYEISDDKKTKYVQQCFEGIKKLEGSYDDLTKSTESHAETMTTLIVSIVDVDTDEVRGCIVNDLQLLTIMDVCQCINRTGDECLEHTKDNTTFEGAGNILNNIMPLLIDRCGEHGDEYMQIRYNAVLSVLGGVINVEEDGDDKRIIVNNWLTDIIKKGP